MATVTALRSAGRNRIAVGVDGTPWRTLPAEVVVQARLRVGCTLERSVLRLVRRELRRAEALAVATRALAAGDQSARALAETLARRGIAPAASAEALRVLERSGLLDDRRSASTRARSLADRGYGDEAIRADLEGRGIDPQLAAEAVMGLEPEAERAAVVVRRRGLGPRTARFLVTKGFGPEAVEAACGGDFAKDP